MSFVTRIFPPFLEVSLFTSFVDYIMYTKLETLLFLFRICSLLLAHNNGRQYLICAVQIVFRLPCPKSSIHHHISELV